MRVRLKWFWYIVVIFVSVHSGALAQGDPSLKIADMTAVAGQKVSGFIEIEPLDDKGTRIPVSILKGHVNGPVLALIAGTHGYEYAPVMGVQVLAQTLDLTELSGTLILVHVANMPSFLGRTIYYSPADGINLNRAFPGKADGSVSQRIAHAITTQVIEQADYVVDMHSGDGNEALRPYIYMPETGTPQMDALIKGMALAFGVDHIVIDKSHVTAPDMSIFTDMTALSRGIPAMTTEIGGVGSTDAQWVDMNVQGAINLMRHLKMLPDEAAITEAVVWLKGYEVVTSPETGVFAPRVKEGYLIAKGGVLGELRDLFGAPITTIKAPFAGVVNYVITTPPVSKGEPVAMISRLNKPD
jgi:predicted deacylase